jgi:CheY-like chemotaxis protein
MPLINGYDVCRMLREQPWARGTPIVAITGWGQEEDQRRAIEAGFSHHLTKPVDLAQLEHVLRGARTAASGESGPAM